MDNITLQKAIELALLNPSLMQRQVYDLADVALNGKYDVVNASNPFAYLVEVNAASISAQASNYRSVLSELYPRHATDEETLYRFMSDKDYDGRFGTPSSAPFRLIIRKEEIVTRAVQVGDTKVKKLVIPRNSRVEIAGVVFGLHYPIEIRLLPHGGLQVVFNVERTSPLKTLTSNVVDWSVVNSVNGEFVVIDLVLEQFELTSRVEAISSAIGFSKRYAFNDKYYYCRVYHSNNSKDWTEIHTTHSEQVYDPTKPTAVLQVLDGQLKVSIPQIYFSAGTIRPNLRVDIYSTKGALDMNLSGFPVDQYVTRWYDYDNDDNGVYSAPLSVMAVWSIFSEGSTSGGTDPIDFDTFRERVVSNGLTDSDEISPAQLKVSLEKRGYGVVTNIDHVTSLVYLATRALPSPEIGNIVSGANCCVDQFAGKFEDLVRNTQVVDNGGRITLKPTALYKYVDGKVTLCDDLERANLLHAVDSNPELLANTINQNDYIYSPFHYVLDTTQDFFECRGYYLDHPKIAGRRFIQENETAEIEVATGSYDFVRVADGWELYVKTRSGKSYRDLKDTQVFTQLAVRPVGESTPAYINGELKGVDEEERIWCFKLESNFDIDYMNNLTLTNLRMFGNEPQNVSVALTSDFEIYHLVSADAVPVTFEKSDIDSEIADELLPKGAAGVVHEKLTLDLGRSLNQLWSNARMLVTDEDYVKYSENVQAVYEKNEFERDPGTGAILWVTKPDGSLEPKKLLHSKGDLKFLDDGSPEWAHQVGEIKMVNGKPVIKDPRKLLCRVELFFLEGSLYFVNDVNDVKYREALAGSLVGYLDSDIATFNRSLLPGTDLYFSPVRTLGRTKAIVEDGRVDWVQSSLSFRVTYYLGATQYSNMAFRDTLEKTAKQVIANALTRNEVSISQINEEIRQALGNDRVPVDIDGLGDDGRLTTFTLFDDSSRCGMRHRLKVLADETVQIEDDITFQWVRHRET